MWYRDSLEYYSAIKKNEILLLFTAKWRTLYCVKKARFRKTNTVCSPLYVKAKLKQIEKKQKTTKRNYLCVQVSLQL